MPRAVAEGIRRIQRVIGRICIGLTSLCHIGVNREELSRRRIVVAVN